MWSDLLATFVWNISKTEGPVRIQTDGQSENAKLSSCFGESLYTPSGAYIHFMFMKDIKGISPKNLSIINFMDYFVIKDKGWGSLIGFVLLASSKDGRKVFTSFH